MIQSYEDKHHFQDQNGPFALNKIQIIVITFIYLVAPLKIKFKKILTVDLELWWCTIFRPKMVHLPQTKFFLESYYYHSRLPISPFHCAKFLKKFFQQIQSYEDVQFLGPKWPISPNENFFRKPVNEPYFFIHAYLHAKNQSQILIY